MYMPDITSIPISSNDYINESQNLAPKKIVTIFFPKLLSLIQQKFKFCHDRLFQLYSKLMFHLA